MTDLIVDRSGRPLARAPLDTSGMSEAGQLMATISAAASNPAIDVDKLERLMGLYERITDRQAEQAFHEAMNGAQEELRPVAADASNPQTKSKYASYPALDRAVRPIYSRHGFSLSFDTGDGAPADCVRVLCRVAHRDGYSRTHHVDMPADGKGAKGGDVMTKTHATGAAMSYGQRYLLKLIFNIAVGEDDDGNSAQRVTPDQAGEIQALMDDVGADRDKFLNYMRADSIAQIPAAKFKVAIAALEKKRNAA